MSKSGHQLVNIEPPLKLFMVLIQFLVDEILRHKTHHHIWHSFIHSKEALDVVTALFGSLKSSVLSDIMGRRYLI